MKKIKRNPIVSALLSILFPGLGQMYNVKISKSIAITIIILVVIPIINYFKILNTFKGYILIVIISIIMYLLIILDALLSSIKNKNVKLKKYNRWYYYILYVILISLMLSNYGALMNYLHPGVKSYTVKSGSMIPTLEIDDQFVSDLSYYFDHGVSRGEVVVYKSPVNENTIYTHRCLAVENDIVRIDDNGNVYVNKKKVDEKYLKQNIGEESFGVIQNILPDGRVPKNSIVVLGDNRSNAFDSRSFGYVPVKNVVAKPLYIFWSKNKNRIGKAIN